MEKVGGRWGLGSFFFCLWGGGGVFVFACGRGVLGRGLEEEEASL